MHACVLIYGTHLIELLELLAIEAERRGARVAKLEPAWSPTRPRSSSAQRLVCVRVFELSYVIVIV